MLSFSSCKVLEAASCCPLLSSSRGLLFRETSGHSQRRTSYSSPISGMLLAAQQPDRPARILSDHDIAITSRRPRQLKSIL